ncbi:MAG: DUF1351 domain-containing protein [Solobacterium sp.]|nr:DUF1351 domain-containing protein [Solobacterium sp.]
MAEEKALEVRVEQQLGLLNWNFDELNAQLDEQLEKYRGLTFTDDQMPEAKKTRAALNKVATEINNRKISVKKEFCAPYEQFEAQAKVLINKIKDVSGAIDQQVKSYEESKKEEKRKKIAAWWAENGKRTVPIEKIFDERWLNATCSDSKWQDELETIKVRITNQIFTISMMSEDVGQEKLDLMLTEYMKRLSLDDAVKAWKDHEEAIKRAEQEKERLEQERLRKEAEQAEMAAKPEPQPVPEANEAHELGPDDYLYSPTFKVVDLTFQQAMDLTNYMKNNGIKFISIAKERRKK